MAKTTKLMLAALCVTTCAPAAPPATPAAETYRWRPVAIGGGGFMTGVSIDPAGTTMVARSDVYGAYIWDAAQDRWTQLVTSASMPASYRVQDGIATGAYEIAVAPSRPDRLYMAIKGRLFRSDDRGRHWIEPNAGDPFPFVWNTIDDYRSYGSYIAVDPADPDVVLLGTPGAGLWRSTDGGAQWRHVASVPAGGTGTGVGMGQAPGIGAWFDPTGPKAKGRVFAASAGHGVFASVDGGATFMPLASGPDQPITVRRATFARDGSFYAVDTLGKAAWVYRGGAWHKLSSLPATDYAAVAAEPQGDQVVVIDQGGQGFRTRDGGASWDRLAHATTPGPKDPPWFGRLKGDYSATADLVFDPLVPGRLWAANGIGMLRAELAPTATTTAWVSQTRGIEDLVANDVIQPPGGPAMFAAWDFGIHVKRDLNAFSTTFAPNERGLISAQQLDWTPARRGLVVTNASDARLGCCAEDGNAVMAGTSTDYGASWSKFATLPTPAGTKPDDPWRMAFGTIAVSSGDPDAIVWAPAFNRTPFSTLDGGKSWSAVALPGAIGPGPGSFAQLYLQRKTLAADKTLPGTFYLVHSGDAPNAALAGLWKSVDSGRHWNKVFSGEIAPASNMAAKLRSVPGQAGHLFFTSNFPHTDDTRLRRSTDGGATWTVVPGVDHVDDIAFGKAAPGAGYPAIYVSGKVDGSYGVWRSVDGAAHWHRLADFALGSLDKVNTIGADPDVFGRVYLGYNGSGWIWGEPARCSPHAHRSGEAETCSGVD